MSKSMAAEFAGSHPRELRQSGVQPGDSLSAEFAGGALTEESKKRFLSSIPPALLLRRSTCQCLLTSLRRCAFVSGVCIEVDGARCV